MAAKTYAKEAKTIMNKYKLRLGDKFDKGDPLALAAMSAELTELQAKQEQTRIAELPKDVQPMAREFAKGGILPQYPYGGGLYNFQQGVAPTLDSPRGMNSLGAFQSELLGPGFSGERDFSLNSVSSLGGNKGSSGGDGGGFKSRVPWMGAAAGAIGGILANRKLDLPTYDYEEYKPEKARANLVDYSRGREQTMRERDQAQGMITRNARGTGSQAGLMENILAGATGTQRAAGTAFNQSLENEGNVNAQIKNRASEFNALQETQASQINARSKLYANQIDRENVLINDRRKQGQIGSVVNAIQGYGQDLMSAKRDDQMINMMSAESGNYDIRQGEDSFFKRFFQISQDGKIEFRNTGDKSA